MRTCSDFRHAFRPSLSASELPLWRLRSPELRSAKDLSPHRLPLVSGTGFGDSSIFAWMGRACWLSPLVLVATIHNRSLRWGAPACQAPSTPHLASYPMPASVSRIELSPLVRKCGLFSANTNLGRTILTTDNISKTSPERGSASPLREPADEIPWHGNPPEMTSMRPRQGVASKVRISSQIGNGSRCPSICRLSKISRQ